MATAAATSESERAGRANPLMLRAISPADAHTARLIPGTPVQVYWGYSLCISIHGHDAIHACNGRRASRARREGPQVLLRARTQDDFFLSSSSSSF